MEDREYLRRMVEAIGLDLQQHADRYLSKGGYGRELTIWIHIYADQPPTMEFQQEFMSREAFQTQLADMGIRTFRIEDADDQI